MITFPPFGMSSTIGFVGAFIRRSASFAISAARCLARWLRPPNELACMRQAIRLISPSLNRVVVVRADSVLQHDSIAKRCRWQGKRSVSEATAKHATRVQSLRTSRYSSS